MIIFGVIIFFVGVVMRLLFLKWFFGITDEESNARVMVEGYVCVVVV